MTDPLHPPKLSEASYAALLWVLTLPEFEARERIWRLLSDGVLKLSDDRQLVPAVRMGKTRERPPIRLEGE